MEIDGGEKEKENNRNYQENGKWDRCYLKWSDVKLLKRFLKYYFCASIYFSSNELINIGFKFKILYLNAINTGNQKNKTTHNSKWNKIRGIIAKCMSY